MDHLNCDSYRIARRTLLAGGVAAALDWVSRPSALAQISVSGKGKETDHAVVVIFLRGGADGMNIVVPYGEDAYYRARPSLGIAKRDLKVLDDRFGLAPSMSALFPQVDAGELAFIHACGSQEMSRSHFEAMSAMERGLPDQRGDASGWIARYLDQTAGSGDSPLRAVSIGPVNPDSLRGATHATSLSALAEYRLAGSDRFQSGLGVLYAASQDAIGEAGAQTIDVLKRLETLDYSKYAPGSGTSYPETGLGQGLRQSAFLLKAGVGVEFACLDIGGWDTHVTQGSTSGWLPGLVKEVADGLAAFHADMGDRMKKTTVIVQTEFGRQLRENAGLGTDHGRGGVMWVLGGGVRGGKVYGPWPGIEAKDLDDAGDLRVATDYRIPLVEVLNNVRPGVDFRQVFPSLRPAQLGISA